jgi:hypothetical protein
MAQRTLTWEDLSEPVRRLVRWAAAAESDRHVSSGGLLVGLLREPRDSPLRTLLAHFEIAEEELFDALRRSREHPLNTSVDAPAGLRELPTLSSNAESILLRAAGIHDEFHTDDVNGDCVLGALLETGAATAAVALSRALQKASLPELQRSYFDWLGANGLSWAQTLDRDFPRRRRPASKGMPNAAPPMPAPPRPAPPAPEPQIWPLTFVLLVGPAAPEGAPFVRGQAFFVGPGLVATARTLLDAQTIHSVGLLARAYDDHVAVARLPDESQPDAAFAELGDDPPVNTRCEIAVLDPTSRRRLIGGRIVASGDAMSDFLVDLDAATSDGDVIAGSPVVVAGKVVGVIGSSRNETSAYAWGVSRLRRLLDAPPPPPLTTGTLPGAGNDAVGDVDQLGFQPYVTAFADLITSPHTKPPLTIGIFGSWGSGKSFLLEHIEREIDARHEAQPETIPRVHVVRFNAWEYSATEVVWPGLVRKIVTRLDKLTTWPRRKRIATRLRWNLSRQWSALRVQLIAGLLVVGAAIAAAIVQGERSLAGAIFGVAAALGVGGVLKAAKDPVAQWVTALFAGSDYGRRLGIMEDIKHDLETLEARLHRTDADGNDVVTGRILVLIDDLDRCEPAKAVEVLQAINLLLNLSSFIVVLGIDARIVTGAIEKHYEGLLGKSGASGYEYLDKIVQIPFRIPEPGRDEIKSFVASQLGNPEPPPAEDEEERRSQDGGAGSEDAEHSQDAETPAGGEATGERSDPAPDDGPVVPDVVPTVGAGVTFTYTEQQAFERFADHLRPNPRHLKRLVNVYRLVRALADTQGESLILERPEATIRWLVMWGQWPYASLAMVERFDAQLDEWKGEIPEDQLEVDALPLLLARVAPTLDRQIRDRLDDDAQELHDLLSVQGCGLTWDEIRRIRRYTVNFNPAVEEQLRSPPRALPADGGEAPAIIG